MLHWEIEEKKLELKYIWKISRGASDHKINLFIRVNDGMYYGQGEVAPNVRYGETPELVKEQFEKFSLGVPEIGSFDALTEFISSQDVCRALRFGIESAYVHYLCQIKNLTLPHFFDLLYPTPVATSHSIPILSPEEIQDFFEVNKLGRFACLKVKVNKETGYEILRELRKHTDQPVIIDGNECWQDPEELILFMEKIEKWPVLFIEQPMPAALDEEYFYLKKYSPLELMADESCTAEPDFDKLQKQFHGINMKLMKAGGYVEGLRILHETRKRNMKTMIGCMIETTLGIASALYLSKGVNYIDLDGFLILKDEPFRLVKEKNGILEINT